MRLTRPITPNLGLLLLFTSGCTGMWGTSAPGTPSWGDDDTTDGTDDDDTTAMTDDDGDPPLEHVPGTDGDPTDALFTIDEVHAVDIELSSEAIDSLWASPYEYVEGTIAIDGQMLASVGVRIKGKLGSYRDLDDKSAFKIDFNRLVPGQTFLGLEKLNLNNMVQDYACAHERTAYDLFNAMGVPAPRVGYGWVRVNGADYGLYTLVEVYDDVFLRRHFDDPTGNLYDGDYYLWPDWTYTLIDFVDPQYQYYVLDEGVDVGMADIVAVVDAVAAVNGTDQFTPVVGALVDLENFTRFWATDAWIGQHDGYVHFTNNYRVYFDPHDGLADIMPWDPDWAFYAATDVTQPVGILAQACKADPACHSHFLDAVEEVGQAAHDAHLEQQLSELITLIQPYVESDPRREYTLDTVLTYQADLYNWLQTRAAVLENTVGL